MCNILQIQKEKHLDISNFILHILLPILCFTPREFIFLISSQRTIFQNDTKYLNSLHFTYNL